MIVDVKSIVEEKKIYLKKEVDSLKSNNITPKLAVILANNDDASKIYVSKKQNMCKELGIEEVEYFLDESITNDELLSIISKLNNDITIDGILLQLPVYKHLNEKQLLSSIDPDKDVDGFNPVNLGRLVTNEECLTSCTPKGIMSILDNLKISLDGMNAVVIGRSVIVGKPMAHLLLNRGCTVTICHSKTKDLSFYTKNADIVVVAIGKPKFITSDILKKDSIVIDVGINRIDGKVVGDVDTLNVSTIAKYVTPVPGGVGLTTVVSLLENVISVAKKRK